MWRYLISDPNRIGEVRQRRGLTLEELGARVGLSYGQVA